MSLFIVKVLVIVLWTTLVTSYEITVGNPASESPIICPSSDTTCIIDVTGKCEDCNAEYHCPSSIDCIYCNIKCNSDDSCAYSTVYSYSCDNVNISTISGDFAMFDMRIVGPQDGILYISVDADADNAFKDSTIISNMTSNIIIDISSTSTDEDIAPNLKIYGQNVTDTLELTCNASCADSVIYCPDTDEGKCIINCPSSSATVGEGNCQFLEIYAIDGIPRDLEIECAGEEMCQRSKVYCAKDYSKNQKCSLNYENNIWECQGNCTFISTSPTLLPTNFPSQYPSNSPSSLPSSSPSGIPSTIPTKIPSNPAQPPSQPTKADGEGAINIDSGDSNDNGGGDNTNESNSTSSKEDKSNSGTFDILGFIRDLYKKNQIMVIAGVILFVLTCCGGCCLCYLRREIKIKKLKDQIANVQYLAKSAEITPAMSVSKPKIVIRPTKPSVRNVISNVEINKHHHEAVDKPDVKDNEQKHTPNLEVNNKNHDKTDNKSNIDDNKQKLVQHIPNLEVNKHHDEADKKLNINDNKQQLIVVQDTPNLEVNKLNHDEADKKLNINDNEQQLLLVQDTPHLEVKKLNHDEIDNKSDVNDNEQQQDNVNGGNIVTNNGDIIINDGNGDIIMNDNIIMTNDEIVIHDEEKDIELITPNGDN